MRHRSLGLAMGGDFRPWIEAMGGVKSWEFLGHGSGVSVPAGSVQGGV